VLGHATLQLVNTHRGMSVHQKLMQARIMLQSRKLTKTGKNKFAQYSYFELADFLPTVQEIFSEVGICGVVSYGMEQATLTIFNSEDPDDLIEICSPMSSAALKGAHEIQNLGAVQTYLRRYLWVTAMEIVEHDALDAVLGSDDKEPQAAGKALKPVVKEAAKSVEKELISESGITKHGMKTVLALTDAAGLVAKLTELGITKYGMKTVLAITESGSVEEIPALKVAALLKAVGPEHVKMFNEGKNSKGTQVIQAPVKDKISGTSSIDELENAANEAFGDD